MYPVNLNLTGVPCLVVGGGHVALRKITRLLKEHAHVTVTAPEVIPDILSLHRAGKLSWNKDVYHAGASRGFRFVVTASGARDVALLVSKEAGEYHFLYNAADFPPLGNCSLPAVLEKGGLQVAVSTSGGSPAMSKFVKNWLGETIPDSFGEWLSFVEMVRGELKEDMKSSAAREAFWRLVFGSDVMGFVMQGKINEAEERVRHAVSRIRVES